MGLTEWVPTSPLQIIAKGPRKGNKYILWPFLCVKCSFYPLSIINGRMIDVIVFAANKTLEKKLSEEEELKMRLEADLREKVKKMEKELENATTKAAGKHCCKNTQTHIIQCHKKVCKTFGITRRMSNF